MINKARLFFLLLFISCSKIIADEIEVRDNQIVEASDDSSKPIEQQYQDKTRQLESNAYRKVLVNTPEVAKKLIIKKNNLTQTQVDQKGKQAVVDLEIKEGESLSGHEKVTLQEKVNNVLGGFTPIQTSFFNGFRLSETFTHAMLNTQQETGDPLFMLQARNEGILEDDYIYMGASLAVLDWNSVTPVPKGAEAKDFSYDVDAYLASTITPWVSTLVGFSLYSNQSRKLNFDPNTLYFIVGNLSESPVFGYVANSTLTFGNFDIVSNFVSSLTRLYFMQSGGNMNLSYHTDQLHLNAIVMATNPDTYFGTTNAWSPSGAGFSLNSKYVYDMDTVGDYWYVGAAYTNATGFYSKDNRQVGAFDLNYGMSVHKFDFQLEGLITDKGVSGISDASAVSPKNIAGVPFFGAVAPSVHLIYDDFFGSGSVIGAWSAQANYAATVYEKRLIPYVNFSQVIQNLENNSYMYGLGGRYNIIRGGWLGLDYTRMTTKSTNFHENQNYISVTFRLYI